VTPRSKVNQAAVRRVLNAAKAADFPVDRIEVDGDKIIIFPSGPEELPSDGRPNTFDAILGRGEK
jgi:hypothetical protein